LCGVSAHAAAAVTDDALRDLPRDGVEPAYEIWRRRIQKQLMLICHLTYSQQEVS
jgi:hypothetical protein